jgi:hypothetical protein
MAVVFSTRRRVAASFLVGLSVAPAAAVVVLAGVDMLPGVTISWARAVIGILAAGAALVCVGVWPTAGRPRLRAASIGGGLGLLLLLVAIFQWVWPSRG